MAQTGYTPILLYSSTTAAQAPAAGNLTNSTFGSELAINITDGKLFYKDNTNAVQVIAWKTTPTTAGGTGLTSYTAGDLTYYASGTTLTKLAIGANTTILTSSGTAPQWSAASGVTVGTATNLAGGVAGSVPYQTAAGTTAMLAIGASGRWLGSSGTAPQWNAPAALTETDDTNVTMTLGGSPSTALLNAVSITLGWTGQLAVTRGGTGLATVAQGDILYGSAANTLTALAKNTTATRYLSNTGASNNPAWAQIDLSNGVTGTLPVGNGGTGTATAFTAGSVIFAGASGVYSQKNANFFWDNTNNRLGIGTASPATILQVAASVPDVRITASGGADCQILSDGSNVYLGPTGAHNLRLQANGSTRAVVFSSGGVSIGNTTDPGAGGLMVNADGYFGTTSKLNSNTNYSFQNNSSSDNTMWIQNANTNDGSTKLVLTSARAANSAYNFINCGSNFPTSFTTQFTVRGDGVVFAQNTTIQSLSDIRVKENIKDATDGLDVILALKPKRFDFKKGFGNEKKNVLGFIAQEMESVFPDAIDSMPDPDGDGPEEPYKSIGPGSLIPVLVKAIQELSNKVTILENKQNGLN